MSKLQKINEILPLFDTYKNLLTDNQVKIFTLYFLEDSSLSEIAEQFNVSRPSISDTLKKTEEKLIKYEAKLKLVNRNKKINKLLDKIKELL